MSESASTLVIDGNARASDLGGRVATSARTHRSQLQLLLAVSIYFVFACQLTWPLIFHLTHSIYGIPGDPYGTMAFYRELVNHHLNPFLSGTVHQFSAPEGLSIPWPRDLASAPGVLTLYLLTFSFGATPALGIYTLGGYILTGTATFLLARRLTGNAWASLIAGWAYAFYPFAILNGLAHIDNIQGWVFVIAVWRMIELMWLPTRRNGVLAGLAVIFAMWWSPYFILFGGVAYLTITTTALLLAWRDRKLRTTLAPQLIAALIVLAFLAYLAVISTLGVTEGIGVRTTNTTLDLYIYAARPFQYFLPDFMSPLFGGQTHHYIETHQYGSSSLEDTLYLGITVVVLAAIAFVALIRHKLRPQLGSAVLVLSLLAVAAATTSMQPKIGILGVNVPFPSHFVSLVTDSWRVYSRIVIIVMLAVSVLAAVGLDVLTRNRLPFARIAIMSVATVLVPLDLWAHPGKGTVKVETPGIYKILAREPKGLVAEYPLAPGGGDLYADIFYNDVYKMPIINGYPEESFQEVRAYDLYNLAEPSTASGLATLGVRYVLLDASPNNWGWPTSGKPKTGFRLIAHESYANLYAVTARPTSSALVASGEGFIPPWHTTGKFTWLERPTGKLELTGACTKCEGSITMTLASYAQPRQVTIRDEHGDTLSQQTVTEPTHASVFVRFDKHMTLSVTGTPGPQPSVEQPNLPATSIEIANPTFVDAGPSGSAGTEGTGHARHPSIPRVSGAEG